ncbi:hypothetical protein SEA_RASPUTIA_13 [Microbacterium phage Rasputia]|nr:hypothetical protein SEA_RASPUTIA_13 [Microbacterium phage Rasputia]
MIHLYYTPSQTHEGHEMTPEQVIPMFPPTRAERLVNMGFAPDADMPSDEELWSTAKADYRRMRASRVLPWKELRPETRQLYRDRAERRARKERGL